VRNAGNVKCMGETGIKRMIRQQRKGDIVDAGCGRMDKKLNLTQTIKK
jgi:hypothetical protein